MYIYIGRENDTEIKDNIDIYIKCYMKNYIEMLRCIKSIKIIKIVIDNDIN